LNIAYCGVPIVRAATAEDPADMRRYGMDAAAGVVT